MGLAVGRASLPASDRFLLFATFSKPTSPRYPRLPGYTRRSQLAGLATGRITRNRVPSPGALSTSIRPPWSWTMPWVMLRPKPVPSPTALVVKNGSKICGKISSGMPQPLSATSIDDFAVPCLGRDRDPAVGAMGRLDRLHGVDQQVQEDLVELRGRAAHQRQVAEALLDGDVRRSIRPRTISRAVLSAS